MANNFVKKSGCDSGRETGNQMPIKNTPSNESRQYGSIQIKKPFIFTLIRVFSYNSDFRIDDGTLPLFYRGYTIFFLKETIYWYAILNNGTLYAFDIRPIYAWFQFGNAEDQTWEIINNREEWLAETIERIEKNSFYLDIAQSINKFNDTRFENRK